MCTWLAQLVELQNVDLKVQDSSPTLGVVLFFKFFFAVHPKYFGFSGLTLAQNLL